jgi:fluoride exporter
MTLFKILLVGLGGSLGSMARYISVKTIDGRLNALFPFGTLTVNLIGSLLIGIIYAVVSRKTGSAEHWAVFLGAGFCGGFTTFSAFAYENVNLLQQRMAGTALIYMGSSMVLGLLAVALGMALGKYF